jgi:glycosyltransferase involved in cell wall biosynthesis
LAVRLRKAAHLEAQGHLPWSVHGNAAYPDARSPTVSVLITLFNYERFVLECIRSVEQTNRSALPGGIEIVVVDDSSTDASAATVERHMDSSATALCLVKKSLNTGLADARNVGLRVARGKYVFVLDADNRVFPRCLADLVGAAESRGTEAAYGIISIFREEAPGPVGLHSFYDWDPWHLVAAPYIDAMALFRRDTLVRLGGYSTDLFRSGWLGWEDYELWLRFVRHDLRPVFVPNLVAEYRVHGSNMIQTTNRFLEPMARELRRRFPDLVDRFGAHARFGGPGPPRSALRRIGRRLPLPVRQSVRKLLTIARPNPPPRSP